MSLVSLRAARPTKILAFVTVGIALIGVNPRTLEAQRSYRAGFRKSLSSRTYVGPHRPFTRHRSLHRGYLDRSPHLRFHHGSSSSSHRSYSSRSFHHGGGGYYPGGHSYHGYRHHSYTRESHHVSSAVPYGLHYRGRGVHGGYRSHLSYGTGFHFYRNSRGYHGAPGYRHHPQVAFVVAGNHHGRVTGMAGQTFRRPSYPAWRVGLERAIDEGRAPSKVKAPSPVIRAPARRVSPPRDGAVFELRPRPADAPPRKVRPARIVVHHLSGS